MDYGHQIEISLSGVKNTFKIRRSRGKKAARAGHGQGYYSV